MIGGKLENDDVVVEVESKKTFNIAPQVFPSRTVMPYKTQSDAEWKAIGFLEPSTANNSGGGWAYGQTTGWAGTNWPNSAGPLSMARLTNPYNGQVSFPYRWLRSANPDAFGNFKWSFNYTIGSGFFDRMVYSVLLPTDIPTAGKYYGGTWNLTQAVTMMPGAFDYVNQGNLRLKMWATKKRFSTDPGDPDVLIAQSGIINGYDWRNNFWPFHPGTRKAQWEMKPIAPYPAGYTKLRVVIEYDNTFTMNKDIYLPFWYYPNPAFRPPQLNMIQPFSIPNDITVFEDAQDIQQWVTSGGGTLTYDWQNKAITSSNTTGIQAAVNIPQNQETHIQTDGALLSWNTTTTGSYTVSVTGNTTWSKTFASGNSGWKEEAIPASAFTNGTCVVKFTGNNVNHVQLIGNIGHDDTDGYNYYAYENYEASVSQVQVNQVDTEVSTATVTLRTDEDWDVDETFSAGKRCRVRVNVKNGVYADVYQGKNVLPVNTLFTGDITRHNAKYAKKGSTARTEITFFATNSHNQLLKEQEYVLRSLNDYRFMLPYSGIPTITESGTTTPEFINPNQSWTGVDDYSGLWSLYSKEANISVLDAVMITRNSQYGYAWFDRFNRYHMMSSIPVETLKFSDNPGPWDLSYSQIDVSFKGDDIINWITVEELSNSIHVNDKLEFENSIYEEKKIVSDPDSVSRYGKAEVKFQMLRVEPFSVDQTDAERLVDITEQIIRKRSNPKVSASMIRLPVKTTAVAETVVELDLYQSIIVEYKDKLDQQYRITSISHTLIPGNTWITDIGFGLNTDSPLYDSQTGYELSP